jgi:hypothetical protein
VGVLTLWSRSLGSNVLLPLLFENVAKGKGSTLVTLVLLSSLQLVLTPNVARGEGCTDASTSSDVSTSCAAKVRRL